MQSISSVSQASGLTSYFFSPKVWEALPDQTTTEIALHNDSNHLRFKLPNDLLARWFDKSGMRIICLFTAISIPFDACMRVYFYAWRALRAIYLDASQGIDDLVPKISLVVCRISSLIVDITLTIFCELGIFYSCIKAFHPKADLYRIMGEILWLSGHMVRTHFLSNQLMKQEPFTSQQPSAARYSSSSIYHSITDLLMRKNHPTFTLFSIFGFLEVERLSPEEAELPYQFYVTEEEARAQQKRRLEHIQSLRSLLPASSPSRGVRGSASTSPRPASFPVE